MFLLSNINALFVIRLPSDRIFNKLCNSLSRIEILSYNDWLNNVLKKLLDAKKLRVNNNLRIKKKLTDVVLIWSVAKELPLLVVLNYLQYQSLAFSLMS